MEKRTKGYGFDSLVLRYKMAREAQADFEFIRAQQSGQANQSDWSRYQKRAERDIMRFIEILDDLIGEHD